jgi:hypothetical protein
MENKKEVNSTPEKKKKTTNKLLALVILLLLCFCGFLIWQNLELEKNLGEKSIKKWKLLMRD